MYNSQYSTPRPGARTSSDKLKFAPFSRSQNSDKVSSKVYRQLRLADKYKTPFILGLQKATLLSCAMPTTLFLILDDLSTDFIYGGPQNWTVNAQSPWYGGTSTYPAFASVQTSGSFNVSFEGTPRSSMPLSHVRLDLQGYRLLSPATHPMPLFHNQSWSASMAAPHITHRTWTPHLNHTSNGISPQRCLRASIPSMWMA